MSMLQLNQGVGYKAIESIEVSSSARSAMFIDSISRLQSSNMNIALLTELGILLNTDAINITLLTELLKTVRKL